MAGQDILLSVGISLASLQSAKKQIDAELSTWKTSDVGVVNEKAINNATNAVKKYSNAVSDIKIDPSAATKATDAWQGINKETAIADSQLGKLAETTAFYSSKNKIMGESLSDVKAELNSYLKDQAKMGTFEERMISLRQQLIEVTGKYSTATKDQIPTIEGEQAAIQGQINALQTAQSHQEQLTGSYKKLNKEQNGFMHGINIPRLMLWAVGWKIMYGALNLVINAVVGVGSALIDLNETINTIRVSSGKMGSSFNDEFDKVQATIVSTAKNSKISIKDLSSAFKTLTFESLNTTEAMEALSHVRDLMRITGEKEGAVAQALAETYGLYHGKIKGATTVSEEFAEITNTLATLFTKAHVTIAEYQQIMGYIAPTGAKATESLRFLVNMIVFADEQMLGGRRAAMALSETLVGLTEDLAKLREKLGIVFPYGTIVTFEKVLNEVRVITKDMNEEARKEYLQQMFKGSTLQLALNLLSLSDEAVKSMGSNAGVAADELARSMDSAHALEIFFSNISKTITQGISGQWEKINASFFKLIHFGTYLKELAKTKLPAYNPFDPIKSLENIRKAEADLDKRFLKSVGESETKKAIQKAQKETAKKASTPEGIAAAAKEAADAALTFQERMAKVALSPSLIKDIKAFNRESEISILESSGANKALIVREKIGNIIANAADELFVQEKSQEAINRLTEVRYGTVEEIVRVMKTLGIDDVQSTKVATEMVKERLELTKEMVDEVKSLADTLQGTTTDFLKNAFSGTIDVKGFLNNIMGNFKSSLAENLTQMFGESTGIFASMASSFMSPLQKAHYTGVQNAVPLIIQAHIDGITRGMSGASSGVNVSGVVSSASGLASLFKSGSGGTLATDVSSAFKTTGDMISDTISSSAQKSSGLTQALDRDLTSILGQTSETTSKLALSATEGSLQSGVNAAKATTSLSDAAAAIGKAAGSVLAVAGFGMGLADAYKNKGSGNVVGAAMNLGISGAIAGSMVAGPVGAIIGGAIGAITGAITGGMSKTTSETKEQTLQITSAIKNSNRELQLVNRNLSGMKSSWEGFILAQSAYFSERTSVEAQFNLNSQRGY